MSTYSHFSQENDLEVSSNINSTIPMDPNPDPDQGEEDTPVDLSQTSHVILSQIPTDTPDYGAPMLPTQVVANAYVRGAWLPEDNDNAQHTDGIYEPGEELTPASPFGAPITISLSPAPIAPGLPTPSTNDGYLSSITLSAGHFDIETSTISPVQGHYYIQGGIELENGMTLEDYAGNIYNIMFFSGALIITIDSSSSSWKPVDLSQLDLVFSTGYAQFGSGHLSQHLGCGDPRAGGFHHEGGHCRHCR